MSRSGLHAKAADEYDNSERFLGELRGSGTGKQLLTQRVGRPTSATLRGIDAGLRLVLTL